jgi:hypothetical protein
MIRNICGTIFVREADRFTGSRTSAAKSHDDDGGLRSRERARAVPDQVADSGQPRSP